MPTYEEIAIDLENQFSNLDGQYKKLLPEMSKQREEIYREVDNAIDQIKGNLRDKSETSQSLIETFKRNQTVAVSYATDTASLE